MSGGEADLRSLQPGHPQVGMEVVGSDIIAVGQVREVREGDFLVGRPLHRDIYVPYDAVRNVTRNRVVLVVGADQVDSTDWASPPLL